MNSYFSDVDEEFSLWAFGEGYELLENSLQFMKAWNRLHGDELMLRPSGDIDVDTKSMIEIWKKHKG